MMGDFAVGHRYLIRHCMTDYNLQHKLQGKTNIPLCDYGIQQAMENTPNLTKLGINRIVSSDLLRAQQTAEIYGRFLGLDVTLDAGLQELDHGDWEGHFVDDLKAQTDYPRWLERPASVAIPGAKESLIDAVDRLEQTYRRWQNHFSAETILFVMHKHAKALLLSQLHHQCVDFFPKYISDSILPLEVAVGFEPLP